VVQLGWKLYCQQPIFAPSGGREGTGQLAHPRRGQILMTTLPQRHLDEEFVYSVDRLKALGLTKPRTKPLFHDMGGILRKLVLDRRLAQQVATNYTTPLIVLVPEPISGNPRYGRCAAIPERVMSYAPEINERTHPGGLKGYFHSSYTLDEFLNRTQVVLPHPDYLKGRPINACELIRLMAEHLGGVHLGPEVRDQTGKRGIEADTLYRINSKVSLFGQEALYHQVDAVASSIWRCLAPLRDEVQETLRRA
jgi:hypothetical protein